MKRLLFAFSALSLFICTQASAQESYAEVQITTPPHWAMQEMQTFSGSVPSRAWVYAKNDEEVLVSALVTEGIINGLKSQNLPTLAKLYTESVAVGWGAKIQGSENGSMATFCAGEAGYKLEATFGEKKYDYYGCLMIHPEHSRIAAVVTWVPAGTSEQIPARRLMTFIEAIHFSNK